LQTSTLSFFCEGVFDILFAIQKEKRASSIFSTNTYNPPQTPPFEKEGLVVAIGNPAC
jgi:hypothetical protein